MRPQRLLVAIALLLGLTAVGAPGLSPSAGAARGPGVTVPSEPLNLTGSYRGAGTVDLSWAPPSSDGGGPVTAYNLYADGTFVGQVPASQPYTDYNRVSAGIHDYGVAAVNSAGEGTQAHVTVDTTGQGDGTVPGQPILGRATPGSRGTPLTARFPWQPPADDGGPPIRRYEVVVFRQNDRGVYVRITSEEVEPTLRALSFDFRLRQDVKFAVRARNALGWGRLSPKSNPVTPR